MVNRRTASMLTLRIALLTLVLLVVQGIGAQFLPGSESPPVSGEDVVVTQPEQSPGFLGLILSICLLQTVALAYPALRSRWYGWRLAAATFVLFFGTVTFMSQVESLIYIRGINPEGKLAGLLLMGLFNAAVFSPVLVFLLGKWRPGNDSADESLSGMSKLTWAGKLAVGSAVFLALYYLFGYYVAWKNPAVRDYYGGSDPGSFFAQMGNVIHDTPWMLPVQFLRGFLWVVLALLVIRMMKGPWWEKGLAISLLFTLPTLYLLYPNPMMPEPVRMAHLVETAPYQFLFGWFVAWLFGRRGLTALTPSPDPEPVSGT
ncbi:MAG: hypothetical protein R3338_01705 [Thermoanaerobaculia bacterium]|nr:hypothetical protein [Thermoanaerobaculia bacterium]